VSHDQFVKKNVKTVHFMVHIVVYMMRSNSM